MIGSRRASVGDMVATASVCSDGWTITLGDAVRVAGSGGDATPRARKARALIAYLADRPDRTATRAELIALLWSDRGRDQARASLRQCLFELRGEVPGLIDADGEQVALAVGAAVATLPPPAGAVALGDLDALDPGFDRWLAARRGAWPAADTRSPTVSRPNRSRLRVAVATGLVGLAAVAGWLALRPAAPYPPAAVLRPLVATADPAGRAGATRFAATMQAMLAPSRVRLLPDGDSAHADWIAGGTVAADAATVQVTTAHGAVLWSAREPVGGDAIAAADRLAHRTARAMACAAGGPPTRRDPAATARLMAFCDVMLSGGFQISNEAAVAIVRRLVAAAPQDAYAHGNLAATLAINAGFAPPSFAAPARAEAEREAARALALDPRTGEAWLARGILADQRHDFVGEETALRRGLAVEPDNPHLPTHLAALLTSTGRLDEALVEARRGLALDPASPAKRADVAWLLLRTGSPRAAFALLDEPGIYDPGHLIARRRVNLILWTMDMAAGRAAIAAAGDTFEPGAAARLIARTRAIDNPHGPEATALLAQLAATGDDPYQNENRVVVLASLGRTDAALDAALRAPVADPEIFFRPYTFALLKSPRFPAVARLQGLWAYWQATGHWPDICADPALGWRCPVKSPSTPR